MKHEVLAALVALLVQLILVVTGLGVRFYEDADHSVVELEPVPSARVVPEPL